MTLTEYDTTTSPSTPMADLVRELQRQKKSKRDLIANTARVSFAFDEDGDGGTPRLLVDLDGGSEAFGVTRHAHTQVAETAKLPLKVYDRLLKNHPGLFEHLLNGLFAQDSSRRMIRLLDGNVRAVLSDRYRRRDNIDLVEHLMPVLAAYPGVQFKRCDMTETRLYIKAFLPDWVVPVLPEIGDVIRGGVILSNSEVGDGSLYIYPYTDRLICKNGMVHTDFGQRRIHVGRQIDSADEAYELYSDATMALDDRAFFAKCADTLRGCLDLSVFEAIAQQMRDLAEIDVPGKPVENVKELAQRHSFTEPEGESILEHLLRGNDLSGWGYVNAITATARDLTDADRQTSIEILAGRLVSNHDWAASLAA